MPDLRGDQAGGVDGARREVLVGGDARVIAGGLGDGTQQALETKGEK